MERRKRIVLFGNSIILGTVGASLRCSSRYEVITIPMSEPKKLNNLAPDVVLFDLEANHLEEAFSLLESYPQIMFVGVSPDKNLVKMWSGQQLHELSTSDLLQVIEEQLNIKEVLRD